MRGRDELEVAADELKQRGLRVEWGTDDEHLDRGVRLMAWFLDLDGFRHELFYGQIDRPRSFRPGRPLAGFVTGEQGLGHVAIGVSDIERSRRFFLDVMGFSFTDEIDAHLPLYFFHLSPRHHSLALGGTPGRRGLLHLGITAVDIDDVGTAADLAEHHGVEIRRTLGRHSNDRVVSFYVATPSGFDIEYGWGSIEVLPGAHTTTVMTTTSIWGHRQVTPSSFLPPLDPPPAG